MTREEAKKRINCVKEVVTKSKSGFEYVAKVLTLKLLHFENLKNIRVAV